MAKGLPSAIAKQYGISKKGWAVFRGKKRVGGKGKSLAKPKRRRYGGYAGKARRYVKSHRIPLSIVLPTVAPIFSNMGEGSIGAGGFIKRVQEGHMEYISRDAMLLYTGYDWSNGSWNWTRAKALQGIVVGALIHKGLNMLGVNRMIAKVPVLGKYISI